MRALPRFLALLTLLLVVGCAPAAAPPPPTVPPTAAPPTTAPAVAATAAPSPAPTTATAVAPTLAPIAAAPTAPTVAPAAFPLTVTDHAGRSVRLTRAPERIVSIAPSNTEIAFALGLGEKVVGVDQFSNYPAEARQKAQLGSYIKPDLEQIIGLRPDLVLATGTHRKSVLPALEERNLTVIVLEPRTLDEVFTSIELVGRATGTDASAARVVGSLRERLGAVRAKVGGAAPTRLFYELSPQLHTPGRNTFIDDLITHAGGANIAADAGEEWPQLSQEILLRKDPEVIVLTYPDGQETPATVAARPGWQGISAVKQGRVVAVDPDVFSRPGPRAVEALETLARHLHPDRVR